MARDVLSAYREFTYGAPENASAYAGFGTSPDGMPIVVVIAFHHCPTEEGEAWFSPLRGFGPPVADMIQSMPYTAAQQMLDALNPPGNRIYWKSSIVHSIDDDGLDRANIRWSRAMWEALQPFSPGSVYVKFLWQVMERRSMCERRMDRTTSA